MSRRYSDITFRRLYNSIDDHACVSLFRGPSVPEQDRDGKKNLSYPFLNGNCDSSRGTLNSDTKERKFHFELMLKEF